MKAIVLSFILAFTFLACVQYSEAYPWYDNHDYRYDHRYDTRYDWQDHGDVYIYNYYGSPAPRFIHTHYYDAPGRYVSGSGHYTHSNRYYTNRYYTHRNYYRISPVYDRYDWDDYWYDRPHVYWRG